MRIRLRPPAGSSSISARAAIARGARVVRAAGELLAALACLALLPAGAAGQNAPPTKPGFPLAINESPANQVSPIGSQVLAADLGLTPGFKSIIFGLRNGDLYVLRRASGGSWSAAPGWPQALPSHVYSSPAVGDLDNAPGGLPEIVVGYGSTFAQTTSHGGARAYRTNGTLLWDVQTGDVTPGPANGFRDPVMTTPAIGDVNGDGQADVVFGALDHKLYVVNGATGASLNGAWPKDMGDTVFASAALHDMDGDGRLDIIVATDDFAANGGVGGGRLRVLRFDGTELPGFPKLIDQAVSSSPAVGDIDGDGLPEIVHGTGQFYSGRSERVYAWNCDGSAVTGWPVTVNGHVITSPVLANIDGDPLPEVVATTGSAGASDGLFRLYAWNGNGSQIFSTVVRDFFGQSLSAGEPVVADVLGADAAPEILLPTNGEVAIFTAAGVQLTETDNFPDDPAKPSLLTSDSLAAVAVTDLETNGAGAQIEVIAVSGQPFPDQTQTVVHVWNPVARATAPLWGFFRRDEKRRAVLPGTASCGGGAACTPNAAAANFFTITPCRAADTRNQGGPLVSGVARTLAVGPACGVPASAKAVSANVTVTQPTGSGLVQLHQGGCTVLPGVGAIHFSAGQTRSNNTMIALALDGSGNVRAQSSVAGNGSVHLIIDVNGYFQ